MRRRSARPAATRPSSPPYRYLIIGAGTPGHGRRLRPGPLSARPPASCWQTVNRPSPRDAAGRVNRLSGTPWPRP